MAQLLFENRGFKKPCPMVRFSEEEIKAIVDLIFFKPSTLELRVRERAMQNRDLNLRRRLFVNYYIQTGGNGAKAARLACYSPKCAKQTAYRLLRS